MWFLQKLRSRGSGSNMEEESLESNSHLDNNINNNNQDSHFQSDPSVDNDNKLLQVLAQDIKNLVLSTQDHVFEEQDQVGQRLDEDHRSDCDKDVCLKEKNEIKIDGEGVGGQIEDFEDNGGQEDVVIESGDVGGDGWEDGWASVQDDGSAGVQDDGSAGAQDEGKGSVKDDGKAKGFHYPLRPDAEDCSFYTRTGMCKFGSGCKFNHPLRKKNQQTNKVTKKPKDENLERHVAKKEKEENLERHGSTECKYHVSSAGCKYGKACKFNHARGKTAKTPVAEYNFMGLPIRPGEKECPYYMRSASCKYGPSCRFNHPDPTVVGSSDAAPTTYGNDRPRQQPTPRPNPQPNIPNMPSWSAPRPPHPTAPFVPMMYSQPQNMPPTNQNWNGYQAPPPIPAHVYPTSERGLPIPPAFLLNNPPSDTHVYTHHQQPMLVSEYPERPGQPDCSFYIKTGDCKYRALCKFNHPQSRNTRTFRKNKMQDQNICAYFKRHGTCKYGSACKYDHPVNYHSNSIPAGEGYDGSNGPGPQV